MPRTTFISYRREESAGYAGRLHESLERRLGESQVFRDIDTLRPGQDFIQAIERRLEECRVLLALIGPEWLDERDASGTRRLDKPDDFVRLEIAAALKRRDVLVVPVLVDNAMMPALDRLPEDIRNLARRQAITLRDETWDADVDRLSAVIVEACGGSHGDVATGTSAAQWRDVYRMVSRRRALVIPAAALLLLVALLLFRTPDPHTSPTDVRTAETVATETSPAGPAREAGPPRAVTIPRVAETVHGDLIYTVLSGSLTPRSDGTSLLRLRVRVSNDGAYDANFWDDSFRLATVGDVLAPTSGLNELVRGHTLKQGIVTFDIPGGVKQAVLRVSLAGKVGELPLDLSQAGRDAGDEKADAGDALSRALLSPVLRDARPLVADGDFAVTLQSVTTRRFANTIRVIATARLTNRGRFPLHSGALTLRLLAGDEINAPVRDPNAVIQPNAAVSGEYVFEAPPTTTRAVLRGTVGNETAEVRFDIR